MSASNESDSLFITPGEVAQKLGVSPKRVYRMLDRGDIPSVRPYGRTRKILREDFNAWLQARETSRRTATPTPIDFITPAEVAEKLGVKRKRVYQLMDSGVLPSVRPYGRTRKILREDFNAWLKGLRRDGQTTTPTAIDFITPAEAARILRVSPQRVYQLMDSGDIPSVRPRGRRRRIPREAFNAWLQRLETSAQTASRVRTDDDIDFSEGVNP